jgi:hypothetical protein
MLLTSKDTTPSFRRVVAIASLVWPTETLLNCSRTALTAAARTTLSLRLFVVALASPVIIALDLPSTGFVAMVNVSNLSTCGTTADGATGLATATLLVDRSTVTGPGPAAHSSVADPVDSCPPTTVLGPNFTAPSPIGRTVSD